MAVLKNLIKTKRTLRRIKANDGNMYILNSEIERAITGADKFNKMHQQQAQQYQAILDCVLDAQLCIDKGDFKKAYKALEKAEKLNTFKDVISKIDGVMEARIELSHFI